MGDNQSGVDGFLRSSKIIRSPVNVPRTEREQRAYNRELARNRGQLYDDVEMGNNNVNGPPDMYHGNGETETNQNVNRHINTTDDLIMLSGEKTSENTTIPIPPAQVASTSTYGLMESATNSFQLPTQNREPNLNTSSSTNPFAPLSLTKENVSFMSRMGRGGSSTSSTTTKSSRSFEYIKKMHEIEQRRIDVEEQASKRRLDVEERFLKAKFDGLDLYGSQHSRVREFTDRLNSTWTYVESQEDQSWTEPPEPFEMDSYNDSVHNDTNCPPSSSVLIDPEVVACFVDNQRSTVPPAINSHNSLNRMVHPTGSKPKVDHHTERSQRPPAPTPLATTTPDLHHRLVPPGCLPSSEFLQLNKVHRSAPSVPTRSNQPRPQVNIPRNSTFVSTAPPPPQLTPRPQSINHQHSAQWCQLPSRSNTNQPPANEPRNDTGAQFNSTLMPAHSNAISSSNRTLTAEELATRHTVEKALPIFSGNPDEWPLFIVNFNQSTLKCNFSDAENLMRLQKSLRGKALEAVRGFLMVPETVPRVMETLQTLFGRPEQIIKSLQRRLRSEVVIKSDRLDLLVEFALAVQNYCATVSATGLEEYLNDPMLLDDLVLKLPLQTRLDWSVYSGNTSTRTLTSFAQWLYNLAMCVSQVLPLPSESSNNDRKTGRNQNHEKNKAQHSFHMNETSKPGISGGETQPPKGSCFICEGEHKIEACSTFTSKSVPDRWELAKSKRACFKCLKHHSKYRCLSKERCKISNCRLRHHSLLHDPSRKAPSHDKQQQNPETENVVGIHSELSSKRKTLFRIIPVSISNKGVVTQTYAFIDEGSSSTLVDERLVNALALEGPEIELCIKWTNDVSRVEKSSKVVEFGIKGCFNGAKSFMVTGARTVTNLNLPCQTFSFNEDHIHLRSLPLQEYTNVRPQILIGLDNYHLAYPLEVCHEDTGLIAVRSKLGWSVYGGVSVTPQLFHICECQVGSGLHDQVKSYFNIDSFGISPAIKPVEPVADLRAKAIMERTLHKVGNRYEVGLLWKEDQNKIPNNYKMAVRRWLCNEKKMSRDPVMHNFIHGKIDEYLRKDYIREMNTMDRNFVGPTWYIPIFAVNNSNKNKPRLVWDCAAKFDGVALNSFLMSGPDMVQTLPGILLRFRNKRFALCGDIREMFHQIKVIARDQQVQRFLYRKRPEDNISVYVMQVLTFGATCSPTLSQFVKNHHAVQYKDSEPAAVDAIVNNTYVDDWLQSTDTEEEMVILAKAVIQIYREGGFEIRGWISNSQSVLEEIGAVNKEQISLNVGEMESKEEKVLGLWWIPETDEFTFHLNPRKFGEDLLRGKTPTKREVLRVIMSVFDPLGFLTHVMVFAKIILREIWHSGVDWDELILDDQEQRWKLWLKVMKTVSHVRIPRFYGWSGDASHQLHVFVDASCNAFGGVVYLRTTYLNHVKCTLMGAKSKVAPQKPISIPRLELMGAVLGARLHSNFKSLSGLTIEETFFWCDSENVLNWINSEARNYRQFVALRIGEIFELTNVNQWRWVASGDNVADEATKWEKPPDVSFNTRWYNGPAFLLQSPTEWPACFRKSEVVNDAERIHVISATNGRKFLEVCPDVSRFSSWGRLVRATAYVDRFLCCVLSKKYVTKMRKGPINHEEYSQAESILFRLAQRDCYGEEIGLLLKGKRLNKISNIFSCSPYLDDDEILRVYGRIDQSVDVSADTKRPIILPPNHEVTYLVVRSFHLRFYHQMHEVAIGEIRRRFWVPRLRSELNKVKRHCNRCKIRNATPVPPQMGMLPTARLSTFCPAFTHTGLDFFGPMEVAVGRRVEKRWGALFTCLTTRAVYIETTPSLSTDSCLMVVNNFMSRRGVPSDMYTDNGTNFRGANNLLLQEMRKMSKNELVQKVSFIWHFIPPASPHMGGAWERMIKTTKSLLTEIIPHRRPTDEVLRSALVEIEGILNKRPLTHVPLDHPDQDPLTPNDLMMLSKGGNKPFARETNDGPSLRNNWQKAQDIANEFWCRWIREFLPNLTRRAKWFVPPIKQLDKGDIVIIVDEQHPKNTWMKGIITAVHPGKDGVIRSADVKTQTGTYTRPAVKLAILDVRDGKLTELTGGSVTNGATTQNCLLG